MPFLVQTVTTDWFQWDKFVGQSRETGHFHLYQRSLLAGGIAARSHKGHMIVQKQSKDRHVTQSIGINLGGGLESLCLP